VQGSSGVWRLRPALAALGWVVAPAGADDADVSSLRGPTAYPELNLGITPDPAKGLELILNTPMAAPVLKEADLERLWTVWEPEEREAAEGATPEERRQMAFERYGWAERTKASVGQDSDLPLGYTPDGNGNLVFNCFVCHGGKVAGRTTPGAGNTHVDLTTLATDVARLAALDRGRDPMSVPDQQAPFRTPLNFQKGATNAVLFAAVFAGLRDPERGRMYMQHPEVMLHHDMNPPAWWNFKHKEYIYADAFAPPTPRQLMPFAMSPTFSYETFQSFEPNFVHIKAYIESLEPPKYPHEIDRELAARGEKLFRESCSQCHGVYGTDRSFPNKVVDIGEIGTDRRRFDSISVADREATNAGWLQYYGEHPVLMSTPGYLAQPLDGVWASAPYLHNGSIPTLYHLFNAAERPAVWKRTENGYDAERVGLEVEELAAIPEGLSSRQERYYFDASRPGASIAGHTFPDDYLEADEKVAVIEYLKTL
jgi:mono/diheme cytochrome c family protein